MKKQKLLPFLAAACCSFAIAGGVAAINPTYNQPASVSASDSGTLLNGCDQVGTFWCAAGTSVNTDSAYVEQGSGSVCVSTAGWAPLNLDWGTNDVGNYSYVKMTVWSTSAVKLLAGDINFNTDPDCILAELVAGKNEVTISVEKLVKYGLTARTIAPYVSGACTLYFDNFVGYMSAPASTTLLNACDSADGFWCAAGASVNTDSAYIEQGSGSVKMSFAGWAPMNVYWGTASITDYDYVKMTIWSSQAVKFLAGDINFNTDPNCILAELAAGKNDVLIPVEKLVQYGLASAVCAPYVSGDCTLYIDNIVGIISTEDAATPSSMLNPCDTADETWVETDGAYTIESTLMTEGNASIRLNLSANNYFKLTLRDGNNSNAALTKEQLLTFDYLVLDINNVTSGNVDLFLAETQVATLAPDWNTVVIPMTTIEAQMDANAGQFVDGQFLFTVQAGCTLLVDNVRGMSQAELNNTYADFNGVAYSAATTGNPVCVKFGAASVTTLTAAQASAAGVPSGYTDNVIYATGGNQGVGVLLDFTSLQIPYTTVESITFRVYFPDDTSSSDYPNIRIYRTDGTNDYVVKYAAKSYADGWFDFVLQAGDNSTFNGSHNFSHLATDGYLGQFEFAIRSNNTSALYIDSISYKLTTDVEVEDYDTPVITYHGESTLYTLAGEAFSVEATATDKTQGTLSVKQTWSAGAVDASGKLTVGTHTLTLTATDLSGNAATKSITVVAVARDNNAPVINLASTSITLMAGTKPQLIPSITEDSGAPVSVTSVWSSGALDNAGKLVAGTHTCTITATDLSGNSTTATITVQAKGENVDDWEDLIDETTPVTLVYYANGGTGSTTSTVYAKGTKITLDYCAFVAPEYKAFLAWAIGSADGTQVQPGDTITLSGDTALYAVWGTHEHNFEGAWQKDENGHWQVCACGVSGAASAHTDDSKDHKCDVCDYTVSTCNDGDNDHMCDTCGATLSTCADNTKDHKCDTCGKVLSDCDDGDDDHNCDTCGKALSDCNDSTDDNDHLCDTCGASLSDCDDGDNNHNCDTCGKVLSDCNDGDNNHKCDVCDATTSTCDDSANNHTCDTCGTKLSDCADNDGNHKCDVCGATTSSCDDSDNNHRCDVCDDKLSNCDDGDGNHKCDTCGETLSTCDDGDNNHKCDLCGETLTTCTDYDENHLCDVCGDKLSDCDDGDHDHNCDLCGETLSTCSDVDTDDDHNCDICGTSVGSHVFDSEWQKDEDGHWKDCNCGESDTASPHVDANNDHACDECGAAVAGEETPGSGASNGCGGCGGSISGTAAVIGLSVAAFLALKKRKED